MHMIQRSPQLMYRYASRLGIVLCLLLPSVWDGRCVFADQSSSDSTGYATHTPAVPAQSDALQTRLEHFLIARDAHSPGLSEMDQEVAEVTYDQFFDAFLEQGWSVTPPAGPLYVYVFDSRESLQADSIAREGRALELPAYYSTRTNRVSIVRGAFPGYKQPPTGEAANPQTQTHLSFAAERTAGYSSLTHSDQRPCLTHELAHLLAYNSGLQRRDRQYPLWFSEGLATCFELHEGQADFGPGSDNTLRGKALAKYAVSGDLLPLERLIQVTAMPRGDWVQTDRFYAQAWGLFHFLFVHENAKLYDYLRRLNDIEPGDFDGRTLRNAFVMAFGDINALESRWLTSIQSRAKCPDMEPGAPLMPLVMRTSDRTEPY